MAIEDYTGMTVVDPATAKFTVTAGKVTATACPSNADRYGYWDKGTDHFVATFEHLVDKVNFGTFQSNASGCPWAVSNTVNDEAGWWGANAVAWSITMWDDSYFFYLRDHEDNTSDGYDGITGKDYWLTIQRTGETAIQVRVYDDAPRTNLLDTLTGVIDSGRRYRYVFGFNLWNYGGAATSNWTVEGLDLQEAAPGVTVPVFDHHYRMMRAG